MSINAVRVKTLNGESMFLNADAYGTDFINKFGDSSNLL